MLNLSICVTCYVLFFFLYGLIIIAIEATSFLVGLTFVILPFLCFISLSYLAIPKPSKSSVDDILGADLWQAVKNKRSFLKENTIREEAENVNDEFFIKTIGHRACGLDAPENSIAAIKLCNKNGCKCIEIDLYLTADNVPVVFHDSTLDRMTDGVGNICEKTFDELQKLKLRIEPSKDMKHTFVDEKIPTLDECIALSIELEMSLIIDIKESREEVVNVIIETFRKDPILYRKAMVSSFNAILLYKIRSLDPQIVCSMAWRPNYCSSISYDPVHGSKKRYNALHLHYAASISDVVLSWLFNNILYYIVGISVVLLHKDTLSGKTVAKWQNKGVRVMAWTVNTKTEKDFFANILNIPYLTDTMEYAH